MKPINARRERGAALLAMLAVVMLVGSWFLVSKLNAESGMAQAVYKARNAEVLNRAKRALIGYIAAQAVKTGENRPGAFPCPEAPGNFNDVANEGTISYPCTLPKVGRFPWKSLGLEKLVDASGEPLWYVVGAGWAGASTVINSNSVGQLTVDGVANDSVALIIAPGPAFNVAAGTGCSAFNQTRPTTGTPDWRNYLECENATHSTPDATFVTTGPSASFNDQVIRITVADIMPALEAAIAHRIEREILPALKTMYTPAAWGFPGSNPVLPYAAPFADPGFNTGGGDNTGTSSYLGVAANYQGLLPFNQTNCTASSSNPRCLPTLIAWQGTPANAVEVYGYGYIMSGQSCSWQSSGAVRQCQGNYHEHDTTISSPAQPSQPIRIEMTATLNNVAMGLRMVDTSKITVEAKDDTVSGPWESQPVTYTLAMNDGSVAGKPLGSVTITFGATLPNIDDKGWGTYADFRIRIDRAVFGDHTLLDTSDATTGWFAQNEWYRLLYYALSPSNSAVRVATERSCSSAVDCLTVTNMTPSSAKSALLILAGRALNGRTRPSSTLADYFEFGNAMSIFERQTISATLPALYVDTGNSDDYRLPVTSLATGTTLQFRAKNSNTGSSTLNTTATGTRSLVNADGSNLAAATILANGAVEVRWDGTNFVLSRRPFNDRVVASASN